MPLHPDDVVRRTFRTTALRRGYDEHEVDTFLEEVVVELRRLRRQVDEQQAEIDRLQREIAAGAATQLTIEEQQLQQVRREREALAAELRDADQRIAQAYEDVARAESDRDARLEEIRLRLEEDLSALKRRARDAREEARKLAEEAHTEERSVITRLAALRADAEEALAADLGQDLVADLIGRLRVADGAGPIADLHVIAALAEAVRWEHIERGRIEAQHIRAEADAERELIIADMTRRSDALLETAQRQHDDLLETAQAEHDRLVAEGKRAHDDMVQAAAQLRDRKLAETAHESDGAKPDRKLRRAR